MGAWRLESTHVFKQILNKAVSHPWCVLKCQLSKLRQRIKQNRLLSLFLIKICIWIRVEQILHLIYIVYSTLSTAFTRIRSRWLKNAALCINIELLLYTLSSYILYIPNQHVFTCLLFRSIYSFKLQDFWLNLKF